MEKILAYQNNIKELLNHHSKRVYNNVDIQNIPIANDEHRQYFVASVGWEKDETYIHSCLFHIGLRNDKIWIYQDWTEKGIATELEEMGVPKSDIVLGWLPPLMREYGEYAVE